MRTLGRGTFGRPCTRSTRRSRSAAGYCRGPTRPAARHGNESSQGDEITSPNLSAPPRQTPATSRLPAALLDPSAFPHGPDGLVIAPEQDPRAVEYAVEMRRYNEAGTLAAALTTGQANDGDLGAV